MGPALRRRLVLGGAGICVVLAGLAVAVFREASNEVDRVEQRAEELYRFETIRRRGAQSPFGIAAATPRWIDGAALGSQLYLASATGLHRLGADGQIEPFLQVGVDLPSSPLTCLAVGLDPRSGERRLFVGTAGEGIAIVSAEGEVEMIRAHHEAFRDITALLPLDTGRLVVGTQHSGVAVFDGERLAPFQSDHDALSSGHITALTGDDSEMWVGTLQRGAFRWIAGAVAQIGEADGLPDRQVLSIEWTGNSAFVGTPVGIAEFRDGAFQRILADGFFATALTANEGSLWAGSLDEGIVEISLEGQRPRPGRPRPEIQGVNRLLILGESSLALADSGVWEFDQALGWTQVSSGSEGALTARNVSALAAVAGDLWVGYFDRGLDVVGGDAQLRRHVEDQHVFCVNRIVDDPARDRILVATANGLLGFDSSGVRRELLRKSDGLIADHVTDVAPRADGFVVATPAGLTFFDAAGVRSLYAFHGLVNNHVYALGTDGLRLLAGTLGGLSTLSGDQVDQSFTTANSQLDHNWISAIVNFRGDWMIGTYGAGVMRLDANGLWTRFPEMDGREVNPNAMIATGTHVYVGLLDGGLLVYDGDRWRIVAEGLPSRNVTAVEIEGDRLWVGTDNGLAYISETALPER